MKSFIFFELSVLAIFLVTLWHSARRQAYHKTEFWVAFCYALLFEELDIRFFKTYHYGDGYSLVIGNVPIVIALAWAIIIYTSMQISDCYPLDDYARPFFDALTAVLIDLSVDTIAIRLGYWQWNIPMNQGWFGVPAGNLYAWMFVVFFFSLFCRVTRVLYNKNKMWLLLLGVVPILSYAALFISIVVTGTVNVYLGLDENMKLLTFLGIVILFASPCIISFIKRRDHFPASIHPVIYFVRLCLHSFFLIELLINGLFVSMPVLLVISLSALSIEVLIHREIRI